MKHFFYLGFLLTIAGFGISWYTVNDSRLALKNPERVYKKSVPKTRPALDREAKKSVMFHDAQYEKAHMGVITPDHIPYATINNVGEDAVESIDKDSVRSELPDTGTNDLLLNSSRPSTTKTETELPVLSAVGPYPGNLLLNPSFEQGIVNDGDVLQPPPSWDDGTGGISTRSDGASFAPVDGNAYGYTLSGPTGTICQNVAATTGSSYQFNTYAGVHEVHGQILTLEYLNSAGTAITTATQSVTNLLDQSGSFAGGFKPYTLNLGTAPANATTVRVCGLSGTPVDNTFAGRFNAGVKVDDANLQATAATPIASLSITPGVCVPSTNQYSISGTLSLTNATAGTATITAGTATTTVAVSTGASSVTFSLAGFPSDGALHTVSVNYAGQTASATYTAPTSCLVAPVCSLSAVATPGLCSTATNTYASVVVVAVNNPTAGQTVTITDGASSQPFTTSAGVTNTFTAIFNGLASDGASHTVTVSLPGCGSTTATYTAPATCTVVAPVCSISAVVTASLCSTLTNTFSTTATVTVLNPSTGTLTVLDGAISRTFATTAGSSNTFTVINTGILSDGSVHTVTASVPGCSSATVTYTAPVSCTVAPVCSVSAVLTAGLCSSATNTYSLTATVTVLNPSSGATLTISNGTTSQPFTTTAAGSNTFTMIFTGLASDGANHTVTVSLPGCGSASPSYTAPVACSVASVCSINPMVTPGLCASATNTYSVTAVVLLTNTTAGVLAVSSSGQSLTTTIVGGLSSFTYTAVFLDLPSDGASHTVTTSLPGCGSVTTAYTAPVSCSATLVCSVGTPVITAGVCNPATNTYSATAVVTLQNPAGGQTLNIGNGLTSQPFTTTAGSSNTFTMVFTALVSDGALHTITATLPGCGSTVSSYTAPVSCSITPICSMNPVVTPGLCASATNTYSATAVVLLTNPTAGVLTVSNGAQSLTTTIASGLTSFSFTAIFTGLTSDGASHTVTASLPGCSSATTTYTAPVSCSTVAPVFDLALRKTLAAGQVASVTPGSSVTFTVTVFNQGNVTATNISVVDYIPAGLTLNDANWTAAGSTATLNTAIASLSAGASITRQIVFTVGAGVTGSLVNKSEISAASGGRDLDSTPDSNPTNDAGGSPNTASDDAINGSGTGTPGDANAATDEDDEDVALISVTTTPICSISPVITPGVCNPATNTYSLTAVVTLENPVVGILTVSSGAQSQTAGISAGLGSFTYTTVFAGLISDGASHTVVSSLAGCGSFPIIYTAPNSCSIPSGAPNVVIQKRVDKSLALQGDTLTYTLIMTNTGTASATNVAARDSSSSSLIYLAGSVSAPAGTTFTQGSPVSLWTVATLNAGQSLTLTYRAIVNGDGVVYNVVTIPGIVEPSDSVCTSVPILVCAGSGYAFNLSAPAGSAEYRFYNGSTLVYQGPLNSYTATTTGSYSIAVTGQTGCPSGGCCPVIIQETSLPATLTVTATSPTCTGTQIQANGMLTVSGLGSNLSAYTYQYSAGSTYNPATATAAAAIPASGVLVSTLSVAQSYTVRVFTLAGCYRDMTVSLIAPVNCACPPAHCVPVVITRVRSVRRG